MGLRAMSSAISGLQSDSTWLDVIGNNISNASTVAYKASRLEFADQFSQTLSGAVGDNPLNNTGGVNPLQIGLGTRVASITTLFTQGTITNTGRATDIAIQGDGFLTVKEGNQIFLSRAGNLSFDSAGYLVNQNGEKVQGFDASIQFQNKIINSVSNFPGRPLTI
ncbi:MAG TPA: flagellar hook-basal body complex protein, partial [bacterium]